MNRESKKNPEKKKKPKALVNLSEVAKKAWEKRRQKYGDSGLSKGGLKSIKSTIQKNQKPQKNSK